MMPEAGDDIQREGERVTHLSTKEIASTHTAHLHGDDHGDHTLERLGYRPELKRNFKFLSILALTTTVIATWEAFTVVFVTALTNGGPVSLVYGFFFCFVGTLATAASLAEYASISPTSAGQYRWAAEMAPKKYFRLVSWIFGWVTFWGWQLTTASPAYLAATIIQALVVLNYPSYVFQRWHGTLIYWVIILLGIIINVGFPKVLPRLETFLLVWHVGGFFAVLIPLVYLGRKNANTADVVFASTADAQVWPNYGIAFCIGLTTSTFPFVGYDTACHMSEEVQDPARVIPWAMISTILLNGVMGFGMIIALLFVMGDITAVLNSPVSAAGYPFIQIYYDAVGSLAGTNAMTAVTLVIVIFANWGLMAGCSRTTWAFARDGARFIVRKLKAVLIAMPGGLPASKFFSKVGNFSQVPFRAVMLSVVIQMLLGLINIGSATAFSAFVNSAAVTLYISYIAPVVLGVLKRARGEHIPNGAFCLGRWRTPINAVAIVYTFFTILFMFFPPYADPTPVTMNWAIVLVGGVFVFSIIWWFLQGRGTFVGPKIDATLEQDSYRHTE